MRVHNKTQSQVTIKGLGLKPITISANSTFEFESLDHLKLYKTIISRIPSLEIDMSVKVEPTKVESVKVETPVAVEIPKEELNKIENKIVEDIPKRGRRPNLDNLKVEPLKPE